MNTLIFNHFRYFKSYPFFEGSAKVEIIFKQPKLFSFLVIHIRFLTLSFQPVFTGNLFKNLPLFFRAGRKDRSIIILHQSIFQLFLKKTLNYLQDAACACIRLMRSCSFSLLNSSRRLSTLIGKQNGVHPSGRAITILLSFIRINASYNLGASIS